MVLVSVEKSQKYNDIRRDYHDARQTYNRLLKEKNLWEVAGLGFTFDQMDLKWVQISELLYSVKNIAKNRCEFGQRSLHLKLCLKLNS